MPDERPEEIASIYARWHTFYSPQSPGAEQLVNTCVRNLIWGDRAARAHDSIVLGQTEESAGLLARSRQEYVAGCLDLLADDPAQAVDGLLTTAQGCAVITETLQRSRTQLLSQGFWRPGMCGQTIRLTGVVPTLDGLRGNAEAYLVMCCNLVCQPEGGGAELQTLLQAGNRPPEVSEADLAVLASPQAARAWLVGRLDQWLAELQTAAAVARDREAVEETQVVAPNLIVADDREFQKCLRYKADTTSAFLRAHKRLEETLKSDAAAEREPVKEDPATPADAAPPGPEASLASEPACTVVPDAPPVEPSEPAPADASACQPVRFAPFIVSRDCDSKHETRPDAPDDLDRPAEDAPQPAHGPPRGA
jgi:hypothetical protein